MTLLAALLAAGFVVSLLLSLALGRLIAWGQRG